MIMDASRLLLGDLPDFAGDPLGFAERTLIGRTMPLKARFAHRPTLFLARPSAVRHVLLDNRDNYTKGREAGRLRPLFGESMVTAAGGDRWAHARHAAKPAFTPAALDRGLEMAMGVLSREIVGLTRMAGYPVSLHETMGRIAMRMAVAALFQAEMTEAQAESVYHACTIAHRRISETMWRLVDLDALLPTPANRRFRQAIADIVAVVEEISTDGGGVLAGMGALADRYGRQALPDEAVTMMVAGFETTASLAGWLTYTLAARPDLAHWVRAEAEAAVDPTSGDIPVARLRDLPRAKALVAELLRLYPSAWWYARTAMRPDVIDGVSVPTGATILLCPWALHRQPDLWPDPLALKPERFLGRPAHDKFAYIPFGAGPRTCIGMHLAMAELMAIAVTLVLTFELQPLSGTLEELRPHGGVTLGPPEDGMHVRFLIRQPTRKAA